MMPAIQTIQWFEKMKLPEPEVTFQKISTPIKWRAKTKGHDCNGYVL
jgi:hypothetical protein